ncbi:MAG TPA: hypothetical protein VFQ24_03190 [Terriglobia bacterium]|nr:hypothetical protein [Terriglobia bacterium]
MRNLAQRNFWGTLSIFITVTDAIVIFALVRYLYWRGLWQADASLQAVFAAWGGAAFLLSLATGILALLKDTSRSYGMLAVCLSIVSFFFYIK